MQTSNPVLDSTIEGFQPLKLDYDIDGYSNPWGGLGLCTGSKSGFICDTPTEGHWWMCIGCQAWYPSTGSGKIPGPRESSVTQVELYINFTSPGNNHWKEQSMPHKKFDGLNIQ